MTDDQKKQARALLKAIDICNNRRFYMCKDCPYDSPVGIWCFCYLKRDAEKFIKEALEEALRKDKHE